MEILAVEFTWSDLFKQSEDIALEGDKIVGSMPKGEPDHIHHQLASYVNSAINNKPAFALFYLSDEYIRAYVVEDPSNCNLQSLSISNKKEQDRSELFSLNVIKEIKSIDPLSFCGISNRDLNCDEIQHIKKMKIEDEVTIDVKPQVRLKKLKGKPSSLYKRNQR